MYSEKPSVPKFLAALLFLPLFWDGAGEAFSQSVGIGPAQFVPKSTLDVNGGITVGTGYAGVYAAPANGLTVQGFVGIGVGAPGGITSPLTISYSPANGTPAVNIGFFPGPTVTGGINDVIQNNIGTVPPANDNTGFYDGLHNVIAFASNNTIGTVAGVYNQVNSCCTFSTVNSLYGTLNSLDVSWSHQTASTIYGTSNTIGTGNSTASSTGYGTYTLFEGSLSTAYGDYVTATGSGHLLNAYGIYVTDLSLNATTAYGVYCAGNQINYFGGNVGIGITEPQADLHIYNSNWTGLAAPNYAMMIMEADQNAGSLNAQISLRAYSGSGGNDGGEITGYAIRGSKASPSATQAGDNLLILDGGGYGTAANQFGGSIQMTAGSNWSSTNAETYMGFYTTPAGSTGYVAARMTIASNGNVGIGTTSPSNMLELYNSTTTASSMLIQGGAGGGGNATGLQIRTWSGMAAGTYVQFGATDDGLSSERAGIFVPNSTTNGVIEAVSVLKSSGNVGIGTTSPGYLLAVNGNTSCTGGVWSASDGRYKKNITCVSNALDKVKSLQAVTYNWDLEKTAREGMTMDDRTYFGFIAQEVQKVMPEAVQEAPGDNLLRIDYAQITPVLVEAVKEQQKKIEELEALVAQQGLLLKKLSTP